MNFQPPKDNYPKIRNG